MFIFRLLQFTYDYNFSSKVYSGMCLLDTTLIGIVLEEIRDRCISNAKESILSFSFSTKFHTNCDISTTNLFKVGRELVLVPHPQFVLCALRCRARARVSMCLYVADLQRIKSDE